jgi:hypothetical protein
VSDLATWLLEQIESDRADARAALDIIEKTHPSNEGFDVTWDWGVHTRHRESGGSGSGFMPGAPDPMEVLAHCDATRRIVEIASDAADVLELWQGSAILRLLALPYADRPGFLEVWRP